jgi:hypothetical protein
MHRYLAPLSLLAICGVLVLLSWLGGSVEAAYCPISLVLALAIGARFYLSQVDQSPRPSAARPFQQDLRSAAVFSQGCVLSLLVLLTLFAVLLVVVPWH